MPFVGLEGQPVMLDDLIANIEDFFWVETKDGQVVPFQLNNKQWELVERLRSTPLPVRLLLLKGRQFGMSTLIIALFLMKCMMVPNTKAVVIAHDHESTKRLFRKVKFFLDKLIVQPKLDKESERMYSFPTTNSFFYIGTAGAKAFGRGDTITDLHCSEVAFWEDAATVMNGLMQAVGKTGQAVVETTANGVGDYFHRLWERSKLPQAAWASLFLSWVDFAEYELSIPPDFVRTPEEQQLCIHYPQLTDGKLAWRRWKIAETEPELGFTPTQIFNREYPFNDQEAFIASGKGIFDSDALRSYPTSPGTAQATHNGNLKTWGKPADRYSVMGIDVAEGVTLEGGTTGDGHSIQILDRNLNQVVEWQGYCDIDQLGELAISLANQYDSFIGFEVNNQGIALAQYLKKHFPLFRLYHREVYDENYKTITKKLGWHTNRNTKHVMLTQMVEEVRERRLGIKSQELVSECFQAVRDADGIVNTQGKDRLMAMAIALQMYRYKPPPIAVQTTDEQAREQQNAAWRKKRQLKAMQKKMQRIYA